MCFYFHQSKTATELENRFKVKFESSTPQLRTNYVGFEFPQTPVITNKQADIIQFFEWGLLPSWAKDIDFRKNTLNARIETIAEKPSFQKSIHNRCLILADGFYEWQWLDAKGKNKQKYFITLPQQQAFAFAGLWSEWQDANNGNIRKTYTILTTEANELMSIIHNTKKRMPVIVPPGNETDWLQGKNIDLKNDFLEAVKI